MAKQHWCWVLHHKAKQWYYPPCQSQCHSRTCKPEGWQRWTRHDAFANFHELSRSWHAPKGFDAAPVKKKNPSLNFLKHRTHATLYLATTPPLEGVGQQTESQTCIISFQIPTQSLTNYQKYNKISSNNNQNSNNIYIQICTSKNQDFIILHP